MQSKKYSRLTFSDSKPKFVVINKLYKTDKFLVYFYTTEQPVCNPADVGKERFRQDWTDLLTLIAKRKR